MSKTKLRRKIREWQNYNHRCWLVSPASYFMPAAHFRLVFRYLYGRKPRYRAKRRGTLIRYGQFK